MEGTFGVPLDALLEKYGVETDLGPHSNNSARIPIIIDASIRSLLHMGKVNLI